MGASSVPQRPPALAIDVSTLVRRKALHLGQPGQRWLAELPDLVAELQHEWSLTLLEPLTGGSASYVVRVRTADDRDAVLKLPVPSADIASQVRTIGNARGRGYVHLLAHDPVRHAMLLESLGPSLDQLGWPPERAIDVLCHTLRQTWRVRKPADLTVMPAQEKAGQLGRLVAQLWEQLGRPCSERVLTHALRFAEQRAAAFDLDRCVVVHGDPHPANALQVTASRAGAESGFVFVDPDGFLADPAYDCGVVLRDWCTYLLAGDTVSLARRYCRQLADRTGVDETAIWEWGFLERVSSGLYVMILDDEDAGQRFLDTAERLT